MFSIIHDKSPTRATLSLHIPQLPVHDRLAELKYLQRISSLKIKNCDFLLSLDFTIKLANFLSKFGFLIFHYLVVSFGCKQRWRIIFKWTAATVASLISRHYLCRKTCPLITGVRFLESWYLIFDQSNTFLGSWIIPDEKSQQEQSEPWRIWTRNLDSVRIFLPANVFLYGTAANSAGDEGSISLGVD